MLFIATESKVFAEQPRGARLWRIQRQESLIPERKTYARNLLNALNLLLPDPLVRHDGPTTLQVTVNEQPDENRWIIHLLHYIPERRSQEIDLIEDVIPLYNAKISIKLPTIKTVMSAPEQERLPYEQKDGRVEFVVPQLVGHQMIALKLC